MSPSSRPIATLLENGSAAILLIGDGFQSPKRKRCTSNCIVSRRGRTIQMCQLDGWLVVAMFEPLEDVMPSR